VGDFNSFGNKQIWGVLWAWKVVYICEINFHQIFGISFVLIKTNTHNPYTTHYGFFDWSKNDYNPFQLQL
jgi:hypothetical protein